MSKKKLVYTLLLLVLISSLILALIGTEQIKQLTNLLRFEIKSPNLVLETATPIKTPIISKEFIKAVWIPDWATVKSLSSLERTRKYKFQEISPVWYEVNKDGSLIKKFPANRSSLLNKIEHEGAFLIATIAMFDHNLFSEIASSKETLQKHVEAILLEVSKEGYDGIDLDYESTKLSDKEAYFELIEKLALGLHKSDKKLVVTVLPKWGDEVVYSSLPETRQVQDWARIAKYADSIRVMAYDFTSMKSDYPGPIAPDDWVEEVVKYATTKAQPEKFVLGIALYAYQWSWPINSAEPPYITNFTLNKIGNGNAKALTYAEVESIITANPSGEKSAFTSEQIFKYQKDGKKYLITYQNLVSTNAKEKIAEENGFSGVCYWRLGNETGIIN